MQHIVNISGNFHSFQITGTNENGSLGYITAYPSNKVFILPQFTNRKVTNIAVGDFHTLVVTSGCTCMTTKIDAMGKCEGLKCNGGPDLYGWG